MSDDEIIVEFISEGRDMVDDSIPCLIELQENSDKHAKIDMETINKIFRTFHSIKGTAAFLEFNNVNKVTHAAENVLDMYRKEKMAVTGDHIAVLLKACDFLQDSFNVIDEDENDASLEENAKQLINELEGILNPDATQQSDETSEPSAPPPEAVAAEEELPPEGIEASEPEEAADSTEAPYNTDEASRGPDIDLSMDVNDEMRERFIEEADDIIELSEAYLLLLVKEPEKSQEVVPELFRQIHSFKGNCGFMGFSDLETVSHKMETQLGIYLDVTEEEKREYAIKVFLDVMDTIRNGVADVSNKGDGRLDNCQEICTRLNGVFKEDAGAQETSAPSEAPKAAEAKPEISPTQKSESKTLAPKNASPAVAAESDGSKAMSKKTAKVVRRDIRVDLAKLDALINLVGELVIAQAMVTNNPDVKGLDLENFDKASAHLDRIVRDLQDVAMSVRMIPIAGSFRKMLRLTHDLSRKFGKKVKLDFSGEDTEIDKTVAELIADPLVHIIRNALDHGLEGSEERIASGKDETGQIILEARHEGGEIWITIKDDGRGLDRSKLIAKGIERGLVTGDGSEMSDSDVYKLLFEPGFSTAKKVTDVSGRGVGMDVVRKNIEKLRGEIDVFSKIGHGTSFVLKIPLTLAIIEGMLVRVGSAKYTIPMLSIRGCIRSQEGTITSPMEHHEVIKIREQLLPVVRLYALHNIQPDSTALEDGAMVLVEDNDETAAVFVDEILGQHQTVIKGLSQYMGEVTSVSGCTIMGDGDVSLILDPGGVVSMAKTRPDVFHA